MEMVRHLPHGLDHLLGRRFQGGVNLSIGEWQKIAVARAYMRDAPVLVLDEPASSMDARAEFEIFRRFADLSVGKISIFITHRFGTVRMADRILVLEDGRVAEAGGHEDLLAADGPYSKLFRLQAASYV